MIKMGAGELRKSTPDKTILTKIRRNPIYLVLDEIIDTYNVGSLFRLADAVSAEKVFLCGEMEYPPSARIHKASVGTENWVPWEKTESTLDTVIRLKKEGVQIVAIEQDRRSIPYWKLTPIFPVALVVGHETKGVKHEVLEAADKIVELPMMGVNKSFNVWGSAAVVAYRIIEGIGR